MTMKTWKLKGIGLGLLLLVGLGNMPTRAEEVAEAGPVYVIPIEGQIENALIYVIRRGLKEAHASDASAIVLKMHTPGGAVASTEVICDLLKSTDIPVYTLIDGNGISAGAIIALTTKTIYMTPGSKVGDAMPIVMGKTLGDNEREKVESYVDGLVRSNAEFSKRNKELGTAMVRRNFEFKIGERVISPEGQILTLTNLEAEELFGDPATPLLSKGTVEDLSEMLAREGLSEATIVRMEITNLEAVARFIAALAPLLMTIGLAAIYLEVQSPGVGLPAILAAICLALFFFGHHIAGLAGMEEMLILALGITLILIEVLVLPGFGLAGALGIGLILISLLTSMLEQMPGQPIMPDWATLHGPVVNLMTSLGASSLLILLIVQFLPGRGPFRRLILFTALPSGTSLDVEESPYAHVARLGERGQALTDLHPGGGARFGQRKLDVISRGEYIEEGTDVEIVELHGTRMVVAAVNEKEDV